MEHERLRAELKDRAEKVTKEDLQRTVQESQRIEQKVRSSSILKKQWAKVRLLIMLLKDYMNGEYTEIPWGTIAAIVVVLLYILSPIDIVPDFIPVAGYIDDITLLLILWTGILADVKRYCEWKAERDKEAKQLCAEAFGED